MNLPAMARVACLAAIVISLIVSGIGGGINNDKTFKSIVVMLLWAICAAVIGCWKN